MICFFLLSETKSSQSCPICHCTPKQFNDKDRQKFKAKKSALIYGCQPLHATINIFNCLLHISYKINLKVWHAKTEQQKGEVKRRKKEVQEVLLNVFKIRVDMPKEGSSGNTTTGAICRKMFAKPEKLANALGIDKNLVRNLAAILIIINSKENIDIDAFDKFCEETYMLYLKHYEWYPIAFTQNLSAFIVNHDYFAITCRLYE